LRLGELREKNKKRGQILNLSPDEYQRRIKTNTEKILS
jgi:hypothetical protein